jgi:hypothetical protein
MPDNATAVLAQQCHALFAGMERAHGSYQHINWDQAREDGKYKGKAETYRTPVTDALWERHLEGKYGLGIIPIRDDSTVLFGTIDIDVYADLDIGRVASDIARQRFPLLPCRSKSGGLHLFCFAKAPVPAADMQKRLQESSARLGFGTAEIFPKQAKMGGDKDLGSWLNMPYFNAADTKRYGVRPDGLPMTVPEFLEAAKKAKQPAEWFSQSSLPQNPDSPLPDGPPCLQHLMELGFPPGTWNTGVHNLGIYCKKAHPDNWKEHLVQLNALHVPIDKWPASDLDPIKKSLAKKDYFYQCNKHPLKQYCDRETCRQRQYGVGAANLLPSLSSLTMLLTSPPVWFLDIEGGHRIELSTEELFNPLAFQIKCGNHRVVVPVTGRAAWTEYLRPFIAKANEVPVADDGSGDDSSPRALFLELLETFCTDRMQGYFLEDVRSGRPYTADGVTIFRLTDLMSFMSRKGFKNFTRRDAAVTLKSPGVGGKKWEQSVSGRSTRLWSVPEFAKGDAPVASDPGGF